jgi:mannosyl-3-phosphoglycerate phosphatase
VVFTDLDGTLLDAKNYRWEAAAPALSQLRAALIPLVLCTSKTRAETEVIRAELGLDDPFVVENGGAIYVRNDYFPFTLPGARSRGNFRLIELGTPYEKLVRALEEAATATGVVVRGFSQMSDKEVAELCGLSRTEAKQARMREFDEAFLLDTQDAKKQERFFSRLQQQELRCVRGGRFWHLMGNNDKGAAVARLLELYRQRDGQITSVGLGDSPTDLDFLRVVELPVLVQLPDGTYDAEVRKQLPHLTLAPAPGPAGWNAAVLEILARN